MAYSEDHNMDRLKQFREESAALNRKGSYLAWMHTALLAACLAGIALLGWRDAVQGGMLGQESGSAADPAWKRELATYLEEKHQYVPALRAYEEYLETAPLDKPARAEVCFAAAQAAIRGERYEDALVWLYKAEMLDPDAPFQAEKDRKIAHCLEKLGRKEDLRRELRMRTAALRETPESGNGDMVLADLGDEVITVRDVERRVEDLPPAARKAFESPQKRHELLRDLVARRVLAEKAYRLELDKTPGVQEELARAKDAIMVQQLIEYELEHNLKITPEDVKRYYQAEQHKFQSARKDGSNKVQPVPFEQVKHKAERMLREEKRQELLNRLVDEAIDTQGVQMYPERLAENSR